MADEPLPRQVIPLEDVPSAAPRPVFHDELAQRRAFDLMSTAELVIAMGQDPAFTLPWTSQDFAARMEAARHAMRHGEPLVRTAAQLRDAANRAYFAELFADESRGAVPTRHRSSRPSGRQPGVYRDTTTGEPVIGLRAAAAVAGVSLKTVSGWVKAGHRFEVVKPFQTRSEAA